MREGYKNMQEFLQESEFVDFSAPNIQALADDLAYGLSLDVEIARECFLYVRDEVRHTGDHQDEITTLKASEVLKHKTGWCYAKSILLAALLRANGIPAGFCYQRLRCDAYKADVYCLHGLNAIYLKDYGWYKVDARGNKEGVDAQFDPPKEQLAFALQEGEAELPEIYEKPLAVVIQALQTHRTYDAMIHNFPDIFSRNF